MIDKLIILFICFLGGSSCVVSKESRILKKETKDWRESSVILQAYADSPFSGTFLTLRDNGKFEHTSSGLFKSFETGSWTNNNDTIILSYIGGDNNVKNTKKIFIDRKTSSLQFEGYENPAQMSLRIMVNKM